MKSKEWQNGNLVSVEKLTICRMKNEYWETWPKQKVFLNVKAVVSLEPEYHGEIYYIRTKGNDGLHVSGSDGRRVKCMVAKL